MTATPDAIVNGTRLGRLLEMLPVLSRTDDIPSVQRQFGRSVRELVPFDGLVTVSRRNLPEGEFKITRLITDVEAVEPASVNPWRDWDTLPSGREGFIGETIAAGEPRRVVPFRLEDDPVVGDALSGFDACVAIPLYDAGEALNWNFFLRRREGGFSDDEVELLLLLGNMFGTATKSLVSAREVVRLNEEISEQLRKVGAVQRSLLPAHLPRIPGVELNCYYQPCEQAGGDYYDFAPIVPASGNRASPDDPAWGLVIADVAGHGASAAVVMAMVQALIHAYASTRLELAPGRLLEHLNGQLSRKEMDHSFVTAFCAAYHPRDRRLVHACAGHYPPRLKKPGAEAPGTALEVDAGIPLGILADAEYVEREIRLDAGDTLVFFTDGITESFDPAGEMFGLDRLDAAIRGCSGEPQCVIPSILDRLRGHEAGRRPMDDQTIVAMKIRD